jgi:hypothetical protein
MDIDAGRWKMNAMGLVRSYLESQLPKGTVVIA